jgi:predicted amidophosphoribosyltransferase
LLWSFRDSKICLHHQAPLVEECPHCATRLPAIANLSPPGFCSRCRKWMGVVVNSNGKLG